MQKRVFAFDFGASSGRGIIGEYRDGKIVLTEVHRFSNDPVLVRGTYFWDFLRLFFEIKQGILKAVNAGFGDFSSIGIDTWGVDFGLLDKDGYLLENPVHYRDSRTDGMMEEVFSIIPREALYMRTGIQFMKLNTIFQLYSLVKQRPELLARAQTLLTAPDLLAYFLTGSTSSEYSEASTTQLLNPFTGDWDFELMDKLGIPRRLFTPIVDSGTPKGNLLSEICEDTGCQPARVYAVVSHDTGSALAAVPAAPGERFAFISCGTWSLLGAELEKPLINEQTLAFNYTNEGGINRTARFLKNIMGLWLMQECRNQWNREGRKLSFADIDTHTVKAAPLARFINPDDDSFIAPGNMPARIRDFCLRTGQAPPETIGETSRCITESLALCYRLAIERLEQSLGYKVDTIRLVGGGVKDKLLCQFAANAIGRPVIAGPVEATAIGNIAVQLLCEGVFENLAEARDAVSRSFEITEYKPENTAVWNEAYQRFLKLQ